MRLMGGPCHETWELTRSNCLIYSTLDEGFRVLPSHQGDLVNEIDMIRKSMKTGDEFRLEDLTA